MSTFANSITGLIASHPGVSAYVGNLIPLSSKLPCAVIVRSSAKAGQEETGELIVAGLTYEEVTPEVRDRVDRLVATLVGAGIPESSVEAPLLIKKALDLLTGLRQEVRKALDEKKTPPAESMEFLYGFSGDLPLILMRICARGWEFMNNLPMTIIVVITDDDIAVHAIQLRNTKLASTTSAGETIQ